MVLSKTGRLLGILPKHALQYQACIESIDWFREEGSMTVEQMIYDFSVQNKWTWANWVLIRCLTQYDRYKYLLYCLNKLSVVSTAFSNVINDFNNITTIETVRPSVLAIWEEVHGLDIPTENQTIEWATRAAWAAISSLRCCEPEVSSPNMALNMATSAVEWVINSLNNDYKIEVDEWADILDYGLGLLLV